MSETIPVEGQASETISRLLDPDLLLQPERLQSLPASRFSAGRTILEKMQHEGWRFERIYFDVDSRSRGEALYRIHATDDWVFDFVVYSFEPSMKSRTGRITERDWDMMAALIEGPTTPEDRRTTKVELPKLYAGRATPNTLTWARSNRSFRAFDGVVDSLAAGKQPDTQPLWEIGYLMRNTGLDGNGTFLTRSFLALEDDHPLRYPLHAQLLSAFMIREFAADLVEELARHKNPSAVKLAPELRRMIGVGNGSALGLLFFVNTHPILIDSWLEHRQRLIAQACRIPLVAGRAEAREYLDLVKRASRFTLDDPYSYKRFEDPHDIAHQLEDVSKEIETLITERPVTGAEILSRFDKRVSPETWELLAAILLELLPYEAISEALEGGIHSEIFSSDPLMAVSELKLIIEDEYAWALQIDMNAPGARKFVWYKSADAEEPRRGPIEEVNEGRNWALDLPTDIQHLHEVIRSRPDLELVGELLRHAPETRRTIERIQTLQGRRFHSPHMNMLDAGFIPVSIVRFMNAAVHGLLRTVDEGDDRNVLGLIFLGAATASDINQGIALDTRFPTQTQIEAEEK